MSRFETLNDLNEPVRDVVIDLLYRLADDELIIGHRDSEWTGLAPILEEDIAFSSMAQDEMGHARAYYQMLELLGEPDPDTLAFTRKPREFRCASLVNLPNRRDWAFCIVRQFLYDSAETVRLTALRESSLVPLAQLAVKLHREEKYHLMHGRSWMLRLGGSTEESGARLQTALDLAYPHALGLFEPTEADESLAHHGLMPKEDELRRQWESAVAPVLAEANLRIAESVQPVYGGRVGKHSDALSELLVDLQLVYSIDPTTQW